MKITSRCTAALLLTLTATMVIGSALAQQPNPERNAYFGETHIHTSWSFDAYVFGNMKAGPEDAYKFALGQTIMHPAGYPVKIARPLDFMAVTDHAEYVGTVSLANDPNSPISKLPIAEKLKVRSKEDIMRVYGFLGASITKNEPMTELANPEVKSTVWKQIVSVADKYYQPGKFTTFVAYEWTSTPDNRNMHRNIIFKDSKKVPGYPFSSLDSDHPEDLWNWMDAQRKAGNELLAISHNANLSDGIMFPLEVDSKNRPIDAAWAQERVNNEPLTEIHQLKGTSETIPCFLPTMSSLTTSYSTTFWAEWNGLPKSTAAISARHGRTAWRCRTPAAITRTRWESWAPATRTTRLPAIARTTILGDTACWTPRQRRA